METRRTTRCRDQRRPTTQPRADIHFSATREELEEWQPVIDGPRFEGNRAHFLRAAARELVERETAGAKVLPGPKDWLKPEGKVR